VSVVIETRELTKVYEGALRKQDVQALTDLNLDIYSGEIFGFLGPNGSGKTTTIKMMLGLIFPTKGQITILGSRNIGSPDIRRRIGYLPEGAYYPDFLQGDEVLRFYGQLYGLGGKDLERRIDAVLDTVGMTRARNRLIRNYSKGMRQRIGLAQALLNDPDVLILDEPTTGLDPIARKEIRDILAGLRDQGKALLISSHELLETELVSNRIAILYQGVLQTQGPIHELLSDRDITMDVDNFSASAKEKMLSIGVGVEDEVNGKARLKVPGTVSLYDVMDIGKAEKLGILSTAPRRETLEELFVRVVGAAEANAKRGAA
jgi:ABC-2 type transport system ATP-binding protein